MPIIFDIVLLQISSVAEILV